MEDKVVMIRETYEKMIAEVQYLKSTKRKEVAAQLATARAHGDLKENSEYDAAKDAKSHLEGRIAMLEEKLSKAKVIDTADLDQSKTYLGATAKLKNLDSGDEFSYTLVTQEEANFDEGKISISSPIGKGLLGKSVGEVAEIQAPAGLIKLKVLEISY